MMYRLSLLTGMSLFLFGCSDTGTSVYDRNDKRVGSVAVRDADHATVYGDSGGTVGEVRVRSVLNRNESIVGSVTEDDRILDRNDASIGAIRNGTQCTDRNDSLVGSLAADIDDEAAGGACLLLLLR